MVAIKTAAGLAVMDDESIVRIIGPSRLRSASYVFGPQPGSIETRENPEGIVARLQLTHPLLKLKRPDGDPVWIKASAVSLVRSPFPSERRKPPYVVNTLVIVGGRPQPVQEVPERVRDLVNGAGGNLPMGQQVAVQFEQKIRGFFEPASVSEAEYRPW